MFALEATMWHEIFSLLSIFSILRGELIAAIVKLKDWLFLLDMIFFCDFQEVAFNWNYNMFFYILKYYTMYMQSTSETA